MADVLPVAQLVGQALHIVVVREQIQPGIVAQALQTAHGVGDLEIVVVVVAAPQALVQLVVGHRVQHLRVCPAAVIPVDHLAHEPELGLHLIGKAAQPPHEVKVQHIGGVQTDAVNIKFIHPEADGLVVVVLHLRVALVQLDQQIVAAPVAVGKAVVVLVVAPEIHIAEPVLIAGVLAVCLQVLERKEIPAHMVEHAVHDHLLAPGMAVCHKVPELLIGADAAVYQPVINGVVAMGAALEQRADINGRAAKVRCVLRPCAQLLECAGHRLPVVLMCAAAQPQRIDVIEYRVVIPSHCSYRSHTKKSAAAHCSGRNSIAQNL